MSAVQRINESVLGPLERPALAWLVRRLPPKVVPDHLTAFGVCGALLTATGFVLSCRSLTWLWLASLGLIINWLGDSLDGNLARLRHIERPRYGFFIDHTSDLFCQSLTFIALGLSPLAHFGMACLGLITFLMAFVYVHRRPDARHNADHVPLLRAVGNSGAAAAGQSCHAGRRGSGSPALVSGHFRHSFGLHS
jgi:phosphatidylglycerophosphate synthase